MTRPGRTGRIMQETTVIESPARVKMSGSGVRRMAVADVVWMFILRSERVQQGVPAGSHCGTIKRGRVGGRMSAKGLGHDSGHSRRIRTGSRSTHCSGTLPGRRP